MYGFALNDRHNPEHAVVRPGVIAYIVCIGLVAAGAASLFGLF